MRRILRKIASGEADSLGDISTLADPSVSNPILVGGIFFEVLMHCLGCGQACRAVQCSGSQDQEIIERSQPRFFNLFFF